MKHLFIIALLSIQIIAQTTNIQTMIFLGDSLTAGFGIDEKKAYPAILQEKIGTQNIAIINAGSSGDTTYTLLNRLDWTLAQLKPSIAFLCIGANDGLRGYKITITESNIQKIIDRLSSDNIQIVLAGISLPKNYSESYIKEFDELYETIASRNNIELLPFLLKDVAGIPSLNLTDRIHPNEAGHEIIANTVYNFLATNNIIATKNIKN